MRIPMRAIMQHQATHALAHELEGLAQASAKENCAQPGNSDPAENAYSTDQDCATHLLQLGTRNLTSQSTCAHLAFSWRTGADLDLRKPTRAES